MPWPFLHPMAEPAGSLHLGGGDRCFMYYFRIWDDGQRNNKHSGNRHFGDMQKVIKCQILVCPDAESKVN